VCPGSSDPTSYSALAKLDIYMVFITPTLRYQLLRTGPRWTSTGSASCPPLFTPFLNGAPPVGGFCTSEPAIGPGSGSEDVGAGGRGVDTGGGGRISNNGYGLSCLLNSSICGMTTSYSGPCRRRPRIAVCRLGSNNGGASPAAPGLAQYGFRRTSFWTEICPERSSL